MTVYLVEVGVLLEKEDENFDQYSNAYDCKNGYFDENQYYVESKSEAIKQVTNYVSSGVDGTYGIVSITDIDESILEYENIEDIPVESEDYLPDNVEYAIAKLDNDKIIENFMGSYVYNQKEETTKDMKKISAKQAHKLADRLMIDIADDGITFYATNKDESEIWSFDTKRERDRFIDKCNNKM